MNPDPRASLVGLASLPSMSPPRLAAILERHSAGEAFARLAAGLSLAPGVESEPTRQLFDRLRQQAAATSPVQILAECEAHRISVVARGDADYPGLLDADPDPPSVLFVRGDLGALGRRRVGIVGTRNATAAGRATAAELGEALAANAVAVVSGLARGIDGAAHRGVRAASGCAVGVVANGLDRPYPKQNGELWEWVATHGLLLSEWPPGTVPDGWRFPQRNRIIAALSEVLVVVESRERGGSLITVDAAAERGVSVMSVPGSPRNRAAHGTNRLLVEGAAPVTCVDDVLVALGLDHSRRSPAAAAVRDAALDSQLRDVLELCADQPCTIDMIATRSGLAVDEAALAVSRLERRGLVVDSGGWYEFAGSKLGAP